MGNHPGCRSTDVNVDLLGDARIKAIVNEAYAGNVSMEKAYRTALWRMAMDKVEGRE